MIDDIDDIDNIDDDDDDDDDDVDIDVDIDVDDIVLLHECPMTALPHFRPLGHPTKPCTAITRGHVLANAGGRLPKKWTVVTNLNKLRIWGVSSMMSAVPQAGRPAGSSSKKNRIRTSSFGRVSALA